MVRNTNLAFKQAEQTATDLLQDDVKWCAVSLVDIITAGKRLEASVFELEGKHARELVINSKYRYDFLCDDNGLTNAYTCSRFKRVWLEYSSLPIYQPSSVVDIMPIPDGYISPITDVDINSLRVKKGQILITCSGTIGKVSLVSNTLDGKIFSHDLIRMNVVDINDVGYVYTFLKSHVGQTLLKSNKYGAVVTHIEPEHLTNIPIPRAPENIKKRINALIIDSYSLRDQSNALIDEATNLMVEGLRLPPIEEFKTKRFDVNQDIDNYTVKLSELSKRLDGSFHVPLSKSILEHLHINSEEVTTVGDKRISKQIILPGRFKRVYVEEGQGRVFFGGKQILELDPSNKKYLSLSKHNSRISKELELEENMLLITRSGTIGKVAITPEHWKDWIANEHIIRITPNGLHIAGYLYIFLSSAYGYPLITRYTYGSVVDEIDDKHVAQIPIPLLKNKKIQEKINSLALQANELRYHAYQKEQEAIKIMNDEILFAH